MKSSKASNKVRNTESLRINLVLHGQPAMQAKEMKQLGFVRNNVDLVSQAITMLYQHVIDQRIKMLRLKALERNQEEP